MHVSFLAIFEAAVLALALSMDAFLASLAYGGDRIEIPVTSVHIINAVCSVTLGVSFLAGAVLKPYIAPKFTAAVGFVILFSLGVIKLLDGVTKSIIKKYNRFNKEIKFSMFNIKFILNLYANPGDADVDASKTISPAEAFSLAAALSLDGLAVGFGAAFGGINGPAVFLCSLLCNPAAVISGCRLGNKIAQKIPFNLSFISGLLLILLALCKL